MINPINKEEFLSGNLILGLRNLTTNDLNDLVIFSTEKTSWLGKVWVAIKLFFTGKGLVTDDGIYRIIFNNRNHRQNSHMQRLMKIYMIALENIEMTGDGYINRTADLGGTV